MSDWPVATLNPSKEMLCPNATDVGHPFEEHDTRQELWLIDREGSKSLMPLPSAPVSKTDQRPSRPGHGLVVWHASGVKPWREGYNSSLPRLITVPIPELRTACQTSLVKSCFTA